MALDERTNEDPLQFLIKSNDPARDELKILCQADSEESKKKWLGILKRQLLKKIQECSGQQYKAHEHVPE